MRIFYNKIPTFIFTTCGLYSANTVRIFAKLCMNKNLVPILSASYRCAATDGTLLAPYMRIWFRHEKNLDSKIICSTEEFWQRLGQSMQPNIPRFKLYSILNFPNKLIGQHFIPKIYTHKSRCTLCKKCIRFCTVKSIYADKEGYPFIERKQCIHCYRCIHHWPQKALSLFKKKCPERTLYY